MEDKALITADVTNERLELQRTRIAETLEHLWEDIEALRSRLLKGEGVKATDANKALTELRYWLKAARETEMEIEALKRKDSGIAGNYGLDLDQARHEIGCRLAQLRPCCRSE